MKIKAYGIATDSAPGKMYVVDNWFLSAVPLPGARPIPAEMRGIDQDRILAMLEKVARDFERKEALDVQPIPPVRESDSPRSHGGRSIAFDAQRFPCTAKFCPDPTESAEAFVMRMEKLANRQPGPAERAYWVGLLHYSGSLRRDAQVRDMDPALIENALENLTRTQI